MSKIKTELVTFAKAELTASIASVVDFGLAFLLSDVICIYYGLANAIGVRPVLLPTKYAAVWHRLPVWTAVLTLH